MSSSRSGACSRANQIDYKVLDACIVHTIQAKCTNGITWCQIGSSSCGLGFELLGVRYEREI